MNETGIDVGSVVTKVCRKKADGGAEMWRIPTCLFVLNEKDVLVGEEARERFEEASALPGAARDCAMACYFDSFMADLSVNARHALPGCTMTDQDLLTRFLRKIHSQMADSRVVAFAHDPNWTEQARKRLLDAAESAGFEEISLLEGPVSVVWGCENENMAEKRHFLVLDAGESRFSVSYVERDAKKGACHLIFREEGRFCGRLMDEKLYDYAEKRLKLPVSNDHDPILLRACREGREKLSGAEAAMVFTLRITRSELEDLLENELQEAVDTVQHMRDRLDNEGKPVDGVILSGGCARMPAFQRTMKKLFGDSLFLAAEPDGLTARGALAGMLHRRQLEKPDGPIVELGVVTVTIETDPAGAEITLDGKKIGQSPVTVPIEAGDHEGVAVLDGYADEPIRFTSKKWGAPPLRILVMKPFIGLQIISTPPGAEVIINDEKVVGKITPCRIELSPGPYYVELSKTGYRCDGQRVKYEGRQMGRLSFNLRFDEALKKRQEDERRKQEETREADALTERKKQQDEMWKSAEAARNKEDWCEALRLYKSMVKEFDDFRALHRMGESYWNGYGVERDSKQSESYFEKAASHGFVLSMLALGRIKFVNGNYKFAAELFEKASRCSAGSVKEYGACLHYGWGIKRAAEVPNEIEQLVEYYKCRKSLSERTRSVITGVSIFFAFCLCVACVSGDIQLWSSDSSLLDVIVYCTLLIGGSLFVFYLVIAMIIYVVKLSLMTVAGRNRVTKMDMIDFLNEELENPAVID